MRAIVVAGGEADAADAVLLDDADLIVAADAGARWLDRLGVTPDLLVGDLDSVDEELVDRLEAAGVTVERHAPEKDESDAELALTRAAALGADRVTLVGALGGARLDHELANLLLLVDPGWRALRDLRAVRGPTTVRAVAGPGRLALEGAPGDVVTLLPVGEARGVTTHGLRFALDDGVLLAGRSRGLSNVVADPVDPSVALERGTLLVIEIKQQGDES